MKIQTLLIALFTAISINSVSAEWISINPNKGEKLSATNSQKVAPSINVLSQSKSELVFKVEISGFESTTITENGRSYKELDLLTESEINTDAGSPNLPCIIKNIAIPYGKQISVSTNSTGNRVTLNNYRIAPKRESYLEGSVMTELYENPNIYNSATDYPAKNYEVVNAGTFRDFEIAQVKIYPVSFTASTNSINAVSEITVNIKFEDIPNAKLAQQKPIHISPAFAALYKTMLMNYESIIAENPNIDEEGRDVMLVIIPDEFYNIFKPYADWKTRLGVQTIVTKFSEINANADNPEIIKNYIQKAYLEWEYPPTYVLLVGDYGVLPVKYSVYPDYTLIDEDYFGKVVGDDFFPEIMVGRMPTKELTTLESLLNKTMKYEKTPYMISKDWFKHGTVCSNNRYVSQVETKRFTRDIMLNDGGFNAVDSLWSDGSYSGGIGGDCTVDIDDIIDSLSNGRSFLNYRGEAWTTGWSASCYDFKSQNVSDIQNGEQLTFVTNIGCGVSKFDINNGNCFAETWLKLGTKAKPRGACAFIGPTSNSHTTYNNRIDKGIYVGLFQEGLRTPAQALLRGKLMMNNVFGSDDHWVKYQFELFCVLGDPSLQVWRDVPQYVNVANPEFIPVGLSQAEIVVTYKETNQPAINAQVCLSGDGVFARGVTDSNGRIIFTVNTNKEMMINLTVSGTNVYPYLDSLGTKNENIHLYPFGASVITDPAGNNNGLINPNETCKIKYQIKNSGSNTANNVTAKLSFESQYNAQIISVNPIDLGDIAPNSEGAYCEFEFKTKDNCISELKLPFKLELSSTQENITYYLKEKVAACSLDYQAVEIKETNNNNSRLDPTETAELLITVNNIGRDNANNVKATLSCDSSFITIIDSVSTVSSIAALSDNSGSKFTFKVSVADNVAIDTEVYFKLKFEVQNASYTYNQEETFEITISPSNRVDPTGPDFYGYYIYSHTDTIYKQAPKYNWFDIDQIGNEIEDLLLYGNMNTSISIPFPFKFYGNNYNSLTVNNLGWLAFGYINGIHISNDPIKLPSIEAAPLMVSVSWASYDYEWNPIASIKSYYDLQNHRFIIQWTNLKAYSTSENTNYDEFQAILLDPKYYPTASGNGEIIIQFKTIFAISSNCVGLQNETKEYGLTYISNGNFPKTGNILEDETALKITTEKPTGELDINDSFVNAYSIKASPNPSTGNSTISIADMAEGHLVVNTYNDNGSLVNVLNYGYHSAGNLNLNWAAKDMYGNNLPSGVYISTIYLNGNKAGQVKIVLTK